MENIHKNQHKIYKLSIISLFWWYLMDKTENYEVQDLKLADFGRKELDIAEKEMPGLV